jgi:two-component system OmpR family sensor kinase
MRPTSIRARLTLVLVAVLGLGLLGVAVASVLLVRSYLADKVEQGLISTSGRVTHALEQAGTYRLSGQQMTVLMPEGSSVIAVGPDGWEQLNSGRGADHDPASLVAATADLAPGKTREVGPPGNVAVVIRIPTAGLTITRAAPAGDLSPRALVVAAPVQDNQATVRRLILVNAVTAVIALALMGLLAAGLIRVGLRPLIQMAATADAVAAGERDLRLPSKGTGPETDRLALAVNHAFDAQRRAEDRLRTFVADASHELRTPLATVHGWIDLYMQGGLSTPDDVEGAMVRVEAEVGRMRLMVDELALLARLDAARPLVREPVDLVRLAAEVVQDALVVSTDRKITLTGSPTAVLDADGPRLQQVLRNLVGNAVQHTPPGTPVEVSVQLRPTADRAGTDPRGTNRESPEVVMSVTDGGAGITPEHLAHVFERFWRAEPSRSRTSGGGSGLGLAIVEAIVTAHGGTVGVTSTVGEGTAVTVTVPAA